LGLVALLCVFGTMMVLSASSVDALRNYGSAWLFFERQLVWMFVGGSALYITSRVPYQKWRQYSRPLLFVTAGLLLLVLIPGIGIEVSGSRRWLGGGPLRMQPSEIAKFAVLVFGADLLARRVDVMSDWRVSVRPVVLVFFVFCVLVMLEPDMGTTMCIGAITMALLFVNGTKLKHLGTMLGGAVAGATLLAIVEPYRRARLLSFTDPFADAGAGGYQVVQSLVGIGSGGITGVGLGASKAKWGFLPNAHTDFIFAIIAEELGLIGACSVLGLFVAFAVLGVRTASRAPDRFGLLMATGITAWVVFQAFLNVGAVISILPVTGVPLPFLSQGGSSLVLLMGATGVLLNIARQGEQKRTRA
jgi:cell division protein FtsW